MPPCRGYEHIAELAGTDQLESVMDTQSLARDTAGSVAT